MLKKSLLLGLIVSILVILGAVSVSTAFAQDPDGSGSKGEVLPDLPPGEPPVSNSTAGASGIPAGQLPQLPQAVAPDGTQLYPSPNSFEKRVAMFASLTDEQRAQIKAILATNQPTFLQTYTPAIEANSAALSKEQLQGLNQTGFQWLDGVNANLKQILTPDQYATYESTDLPHPIDLSPPLTYAQDAVSAQSQNDCATAYNLLIAAYNTYAYWAAQNAQYAYINGVDPYAFNTYVSLYNGYYQSYYGAYNAYYAYWNYYNSSYSYGSFYYGRHSEGFELHGYQLASAQYTWTNDSYSYYAYVYGKASFNNYNSVGDDYAYRCYAN